MIVCFFFFFFFFNDTATTEIYTLSLHDALPILALDLEVLGTEGLRSQQIAIRPLGDKLWELKRLYDGIQYRLFFGVWKGAVWLVHSIEKKSAKTPKDDLELSRKRLREVIAR